MKKFKVNLTEKIFDDLTQEAEKAEIQSRSNFIRLMLDASLAQVKEKGFHVFMSEIAKLKKSLNESGMDTVLEKISR